jgi:hypothetical protein
MYFCFITLDIALDIAYVKETSTRAQVCGRSIFLNFIFPQLSLLVTILSSVKATACGYFRMIIFRLRLSRLVSLVKCDCAKDRWRR